MSIRIVYVFYKPCKWGKRFMLFDADTILTFGFGNDSGFSELQYYSTNSRNYSMN